MSDDDAVTIEHAVTEAVAYDVDRVHSAAAGTEQRPIGVQEWNERVLDAICVSNAVYAGGLGVISAVHRLARSDGRRRRKNDVGRLWVIVEVRGSAHGFHCDRVVREILRQARG